MIELIYFILLFLISFGIGKKILDFFKAKLFFLEEVVFSVGLGYLVISLVTLLLGIFQLYYAIVFYLLFGLLFLFLIPTILKFLAKVPKEIVGNYKKLGKIGKTTSFMLLFLFALNLFGAMSPPYGIDVTAYHFSIPKLYIMNGGIKYLPSISYEGYPLGFNMLYVVGIILKNGILAKLFAYSSGVLLALALFSFGKKFFNPTIGIISSMIFYTLPLVIEYNVQGYVDVAAAWLVFLSVYAFINWYKNNHETKWIVLSAIFCGFSISTKIINASLAIVICAILITMIIFKKISFREGIKDLFIFAGLAFLIYSPWFIKNLIYRGNPFFPFFYKYFGGNDWSNLIELHYAESVNRYYLGLQYIFLVPFMISLNSLTVYSFMGWGPIFLAFVPLYFLMKKKNKALNLMLWISLLMYTLWYIISPTKTIRILYIYPFLAIVSGFIIYHIITKYKQARKIVLVAIFLTFIFGIVLSLGIRIKTGQLSYAFGLKNEQEFYNSLNDDFGVYDSFVFINNELPEDAKLFLFRHIRGYWSERDYIWGDPMIQGYIDYSKMGPDEFYARLKSEGITHVIMDPEYVNDKRIGQASFMKEFYPWLTQTIENNSVLIYNHTKGAKVYQLN